MAIEQFINIPQGASLYEGTSDQAEYYIVKTNTEACVASIDKLNSTVLFKLKTGERLFCFLPDEFAEQLFQGLNSTLTPRQEMELCGRIETYLHRLVESKED